MTENDKFVETHFKFDIIKPGRYKFNVSISEFVRRSAVAWEKIIIAN